MIPNKSGAGQNLVRKFDLQVILNILEVSF